MDKFLPYTDELGSKINSAAADLFTKLQSLNVERLGMPEGCLHYFRGSHFKRMFFSIETSAHLLYNSISSLKKELTEIAIMDYGAGVGTLYTLAKMIGCGKVVYNDHLQDWKESARLIAAGIGVEVDEYIVGDIDYTLNQLQEKKIELDIITSRNVLEHIYKLDHFFASIAQKQASAIIYSSTTANYNNPASRIKHWFLHNKVDRTYYIPARKKIIQSLFPELSSSKINSLALKTRGLAMDELNSALMAYKNSGYLISNPKIGSNTCDPENGVWAEHMISFNDYRELSNSNPYQVNFEPGFWDTHYTSSFMNFAGKILNKIIRLNRRWGIRVAPFIYIIAKPKIK